MMNIWSINGITLCGLIAVLILREIRKEWTIWIIISVLILVLCFSLELVETTITVIRNYSEVFSNIAGYTQVLLKGLGITCITYISSEICRASGESNLTSDIELTGKIEILLLGLPLFQEILDLALGLL